MQQQLEALLAFWMSCTAAGDPVLGAEPVAAKGGANANVTRTFEVDRVKDLAYFDGPGADPVKHRLDLYLPRDQKDFPVLFFVHGGAWQRGDKDQYLGIFGLLGSLFARHGIGVVVTNYRLSPAVTHPEHVRDVARAFAWTVRNIARYGGRPDEIFLSGHSAGAHLAALLVTDEAYLKAEGTSAKDVRAVIALSGVYKLEDTWFTSVFGRDPKVRARVSPLQLVKPGLPPFLLLYADKDFPGCDRQPARAFYQALRDQGNSVEIDEIQKSNHYLTLIGATTPNDPISEKILGFIQAHTAH